MDLVNIIYRYVNRFISSEILINLLENMDKNKFSKTELKEINKLLQEIKEIVKNVPNEIDMIEIKRLENINRMLELFKNNIDNEKLDEKGSEFVERKYNDLLKDKESIRDCGPRYEKLFELLTNFPLYRDYCLKMDDYELLEFITQYIYVPVAPKIGQKDFDDLVSAGIEQDKRESLWRLAMNYEDKGKDFSQIEDYFILKRDNYYLMELVSGVDNNLNLTELVDKIIETKDKEFIKKIVECECYTFEEELQEKLKQALK